MNRKHITVIVLLSFVLLLTACSTKSLNGTWKHTLEDQGSKADFVLKLNQDGSGKYSLTLSGGGFVSPTEEEEITWKEENNRLFFYTGDGRLLVAGTLGIAKGQQNEGAEYTLEGNKLTLKWPNLDPITFGK